MIKNILVGIGMVLLVSLGFYAAKITTHTPVSTEFKAGAVTGADLLSPYFVVGGVREWKGHTETLTQSTTTVCAIQSPAATSTLSSANIYFSVGSTTSSTVTLARANDPYSTTTSLGSIILPANTSGQALASTTGIVFLPNTWFVVGMAGGTGTFSPTGVCQASWQQLSY